MIRTIDGTCNNLGNPSLGAAGSPLKRLLDPDYGDAHNAPRGGYESAAEQCQPVFKENLSCRQRKEAAEDKVALPNPRRVSLEIHQVRLRETVKKGVLFLSRA